MRECKQESDENEELPALHRSFAVVEWPAKSKEEALLLPSTSTQKKNQKRILHGNSILEGSFFFAGPLVSEIGGAALVRCGAEVTVANSRTGSYVPPANRRFVIYSVGPVASTRLAAGARG